MSRRPIHAAGDLDLAAFEITEIARGATALRFRKPLAIIPFEAVQAIRSGIAAAEEDRVKSARQIRDIKKGTRSGGTLVSRTRQGHWLARRVLLRQLTTVRQQATL
jgi:hypothetical protein